MCTYILRWVCVYLYIYIETRFPQAHTYVYPDSQNPRKTIYQYCDGTGRWNPSPSIIRVRSSCISNATVADGPATQDYGIDLLTQNIQISKAKGLRTQAWRKFIRQTDIALLIHAEKQWQFGACSTVQPTVHHSMISHMRRRLQAWDKLWTRKRQRIPRPHGVCMGCFLWVFCIKSPCYNKSFTAHVRPTTQEPMFSPPSFDSSRNMSRTSQSIGVENVVNHIICLRFMQVDCTHKAILYTRCDLPRPYWVDHELIRLLLFMIAWTYDHVYKVSSKMSRPQCLWRYGRCMTLWLFS